MSPCWQYRRHLLSARLSRPAAPRQSNKANAPAPAPSPAHCSVVTLLHCTRSRTRRLRLNSTHSLTVRAAGDSASPDSQTLPANGGTTSPRQIAYENMPKMPANRRRALRAAICMGCRHQVDMSAPARALRMLASTL